MSAKCYNECNKTCRGDVMEKISDKEYLALDIPSKLNKIIDSVELTEDDICNNVTKDKKFLRTIKATKTILSLYRNSYRMVSRNHIEKIKECYGVDLSYSKKLKYGYGGKRALFDIDETLKDKLIKQAEKEGTDLSKLFRKIAEEYLKKNKSL